MLLGRELCIIVSGDPIRLPCRSSILADQSHRQPRHPTGRLGEGRHRLRHPRAQALRESAAVDDLGAHAGGAATGTVAGGAINDRKISGTTMLLSVFATVALALTAIGIYGVVACTVCQRTREIAVRIALGAQTRDVFKLTIGDGMRPVMIGVLMGILGGLGTARILASQLFGVAASDPKTVVGISLFLALAALLACWLPARRAATVDPMEALRYE